jgi:rifampicin phosphotransferase
VILDLGEASADIGGGKAAGLARLVELGLPVPPAIVIPAGEELENPAEVTRLLGEPVAVRSSAIGEDAAERSAAGQYETILNVKSCAVAAAVARVQAGTARAGAYGLSGPVAVVIQRQVESTRAGVAFSRDPMSGEDVVYVECAFGSGEPIVSGSVTPDRYWIADGVRARAAGSLRVLRDDEARTIAGFVHTAERGFGRPVDVEFCFEGRRPWLVQCRPITTL